MRLNVPRLYLDEDGCPGSDRVERFRQRRDGDARGELVSPQLVKRGQSDRGAGISRHASRMDHGIVMHYNHPIARRVNIELHGVGAESERALKRGYRVFGQGVVGAAVGNPERRGGGAASGQRYSGV